MAQLKEVMYKSHDNAFSLTVKEDDIVINLVSTGVTRMILQLFSIRSNVNKDPISLDSNTLANAFDWSTNGASGIVDIKIGDQDIDAGQYRAYLVIFDPFHTNGQSWPSFVLDVIDVVV